MRKKFKDLYNEDRKPDAHLTPERAFLHGAESHRDGEPRSVHPDYSHDSLKQHWLDGWDKSHQHEKAKRIKSSLGESFGDDSFRKEHAHTTVDQHLDHAAKYQGLADDHIGAYYRRTGVNPIAKGSQSHHLSHFNSTPEGIKYNSFRKKALDHKKAADHLKQTGRKTLGS